MNGDEDLGQDIIMKGDKFHYQQNLGEMTITESARGDGKDEKKDEKKAEKKDEKKDEKKAEKKDEKKGDAKKDGEKKDDKKEDKKDDKKEDKKEGGDEKKDEKKEDGKDEKKDGKDEEKKEGEEEEKEPEKKQAPGEATWEEHNDCKENEWEAGDGNCAFEAENLKIGRHSYLQVAGPQGIAKDDAEGFTVKYPVKFDGAGYPATEKVHTLSPEVHMEYNNQASTYLYPRTAFYVDVGEGEGLWMHEEPVISNIEAVRGPSAGAPIGAAVHDIATKAGEPYANIHTAAEPARGVQHQPFLFGDKDRAAADAARAPSQNPGVRAADAPAAKTVGTGPLKEALAQEPKDPSKCNGSCPNKDQNQEEVPSVNPEGMGGLHGITNDVNVYAYKHPVGAPERHPGHQPVNYIPQAGEEGPKGKTFDQATKHAPLKGEAAAAAATAPAAPADAKAPAAGAEAPKAAEAAAPEAPKAALAQMRNNGDYSKGEIDAPPKGFSKITAIRAPQNGGPVGVGVYNVSSASGDPYARTHDEPQPDNGVQHQPFLYNENERAEADKAIPASKNPGITPSQARDPAVAKTRGTGALIDPPAPVVLSPTATTAVPETTAPASAKVEDPKADQAKEAKKDAAAAALIQVGDVNTKKDISDKNIDEEVWGFVNADKNTLPHQHRRVEEAYPVNGWANPAGRFAQMERVNNKKDISDKNIDEEVWGFVNADKNTLPW